MCGVWRTCDKCNKIYNWLLGCECQKEIKMKFKIGQELYYITSAITIEKVLIEFIDTGIESGIIYYIDETGSYLEEKDLTDNLEVAKVMAMSCLEIFWRVRAEEIKNANPKLGSN